MHRITTILLTALFISLFTASAHANEGNTPMASDHELDTQYNTPIIIDVFPVEYKLEITQEPFDGVVTVNSDGSVVYTPDSGFVGIDGFTYALRNSEGLRSQIAVIAINVYRHWENASYNIAPKAGAFASSSYPRFPAENLNQGAHSPWFSANLFNYQEVQVGLSWAYNVYVDYVELDWQGSHYPAQFYILVFHHGSSSYFGPFHTRGGLDTVRVNQDADQVLVVMTNRFGNSFIGLNELRVFGLD